MTIQFLPTNADTTTGTAAGATLTQPPETITLTRELLLRYRAGLFEQLRAVEDMLGMPHSVPVPERQRNRRTRGG